MMIEMIARVKYSLKCVLLKDDSWDMGADLYGGIFPWGGKWLGGDFKLYRRYEDAIKAKDKIPEQADFEAHMKRIKDDFC